MAIPISGSAVPEQGADSEIMMNGDGIFLRTYRPADAPLFVAAALESVDTVGRWMPWCHAAYAEKEAVAWVEKCIADKANAFSYEFGIFEAQNNLLGGAGLNRINREHQYANLGYWVRQSRQRQGIASAAVRLLTNFGFTTLGLTRIEIVAVSGNIPSQRVAENAGAQFECVARNRLVIRGVPLAAKVYSLIP